MYEAHHNFFAQAYRTGTDIWTHIPFTRRAHEFALYLPKGALILDIGAGRGRLMYSLADLGFRVIGLEKNHELVANGNSELKNKKLEHTLRFKEGDALDIPFEDASFDAAVDVGLFQHLLPEDFPAYVSEAARALKSGGYFFLVALSKDTKTYFMWRPKESAESTFVREGLHYHFFSEAELHGLFDKDFEIKYINYDAPHGPHDAIFAVVLLRKK